MNDFQQACRDAVDRVLAAAGGHAHHDELDYREAAGAVNERSHYVRSLFRAPCGLVEIYAYVDEASAQIDGHWFVFDRRSHETDDALVAALAAFVSRVLAGDSPVDAIRA